MMERTSRGWCFLRPRGTSATIGGPRIRQATLIEKPWGRVLVVKGQTERARAAGKGYIPGPELGLDMYQV